MRVSAIHDRRFPAVNSCTKCNSRAEDEIHRGCKKTAFFYSPFFVLRLRIQNVTVSGGAVKDENVATAFLK